MIQGLYSAASGIMSIERRQEITANNIANASTPGFKRQSAVEQGFYPVLLSKQRTPHWYNLEDAPGGGVRLLETYTDFAPGGVSTTGNPLDLALSGPGYIAVDTPAGERYTRNGSLTVDTGGFLATKDGYRVQAVAGENIDVSGGSARVDRDGIVWVDGAQRGQLRLLEFEEPQKLERIGDDLYEADDETLEQSAVAANTEVSSASLELANVKIPYEMIQLNMALRAYAANQSVINAMDETMSRCIDRVGSPI